MKTTETNQVQQMMRDLGVTGFSCKSGGNLSTSVQKACLEKIAEIQNDRAAAARELDGNRNRIPSAD